MNKNKTARFIGFALVFTMLMTLMIGVSAQDDGVLHVRLGSTDVPTLDPSLATDSDSIQMLRLTYLGLTVLDEATLEVNPGMAQSWEVVDNGDGTFTWTFHLLEGIPWVKYDADAGEVVEVTDENGDVRMVTAGDVVYGWKRTLDPATAGEYAYVLADKVVGGQDFNTGDGGDPDAVAVSAVDDYTLEVVSPVNAIYLPNVYGMWMATPQPAWAIEEFGDFWIEPENFQSYGPYAIKEWNHDESISVIANPFWPGIAASPQPSIPEIQLLFLDNSVGLAEYEAGNIKHTNDLPTTDLARLQADPVLSEQLRILARNSIYYYGFDTREGSAVGNVNLRLALSYAVDRVALVENVVQGGQVPAPFFSSPGLTAAPTVETYPDLGIYDDPDIAREYLAVALEELGLSSVDELEPISILFNTNENHARIAEAIQQMWAETLGIEVQLTNQEFAVYLDSRKDFPVWRAGWGADFPDAHNYLFDVFHSSSTNNDTWWSSDEFDALVEEAALLDDQDARQELYAQAENILVSEDAAIIPIYWASNTFLTSPDVEFTGTNSTTQEFEKWSFK
jgi:oligopeptide transport system substrate-binding protein